MIPRKNRLQLRGNAEFFNTAGKIHGRLVTVFYQYSDKSSPEIAVIVSKKTASKATQRNRMKRAVGSIVTELLDDVAGLGLQAAIVIQKPALTASRSETKQAIQKIFNIIVDEKNRR
jgi:ribonuclease P protein component